MALILKCNGNERVQSIPDPDSMGAAIETGLQGMGGTRAWNGSDFGLGLRLWTNRAFFLTDETVGHLYGMEVDAVIID